MLPLCLQEAGRGPDESGGPTGVPVRTSPPQHAASQAVSLASPLLFSSALSAPFRTRRNLLTVPHKQVYFLHARVDDRQTEDGGGGKLLFVLHDFLLLRRLSFRPLFSPPPPVVFVAAVSLSVALFLSSRHLLLPSRGRLWGRPVTGSPVTRLTVTGSPVTGRPVTGSPVTEVSVTGSLFSERPVTES